eukprot:scaffold1130_cov195-Pinguiococcus_pyrenoidosus.AAC.93
MAGDGTLWREGGGSGPLVSFGCSRCFRLRTFSTASTHRGEALAANGALRLPNGVSGRHLRAQRSSEGHRRVKKVVRNQLRTKPCATQIAFCVPRHWTGLSQMRCGAHRCRSAQCRERSRGAARRQMKREVRSARDSYLDLSKVCSKLGQQGRSCGGPIRGSAKLREFL